MEINLFRSIRSLRNAIIFFCWGTFVLWIAESQQLSAYLHPSLQYFTVAAGIILLFLSCFELWSLLNSSKDQSPDSDCGHHDNNLTKKHQHAPQLSFYTTEFRAFTGFFSKSIFMLLPLLLSLLSSQRNHFSITTIQNRGIVASLDQLPAAQAAHSKPVFQQPQFPHLLKNSSSLTENRENSSIISPVLMPMNILDLLYALQTPSYRSKFQGKQLELIAQFVPLPLKKRNTYRFQAIRMFMTCCAADAKPVGIIIQYPKRLNFPAMHWIKIIGTPSFRIEEGRDTVIIEASSVQLCPATNKPFIY